MTTFRYKENEMKLRDGKVHVQSTGELFAVEELAHGTSEEGHPYTIYAFTRTGEVIEKPDLDVETLCVHQSLDPVEGVRRLQVLLLTSQEFLRGLIRQQLDRLEHRHTTEPLRSLLRELDDLLVSVEESLSQLGADSSSSD